LKPQYRQKGKSNFFILKDITKKVKRARCQWLTLVIIATQEAEITAQANSSQDPISKIPHTKKGW
jgi:hypothetical protein